MSPAKVGLLAALAPVIGARADAPAIEDRGRVTDYAQLWRWAGAIGGWLEQQGVGQGDRVALELGKSADYVAAMLGCWWVGASFIALPPELPSHRRRVILDEARPTLRIDASAGAQAIALLRDSTRDPRPPVIVAPRDPAYVLYTSGSSGRPKGVIVPHRGIVPLLVAQCELFGLGPRSRSLAYLSLAFDAAISDVGTALYAGAALVIASPESLATPEALLAVLERARISYADLPPALLGHLDPSRLPACVETLVIGGEVCPPEIVRRFAARVRLVNVYGPTETTICASAIRCDPETWERPLIGAPLPGWEFQVVDGELWIGGVGVALGYVPRLDGSDPGHDRYVERAGQRMFRTGDRVRVSETGALEFVGRLDRQRKIAGVRIELDEIEAWLVEHPDVREAAVVEAKDGALLAAWVPRGGVGAGTGGAASLRRHLGERLPSPAIPRRFVAMHALPRGTTGKLDRAQLARELELESELEPESELGDGSHGDLAGLLERLWRRILGVAQVDPSARFVAEGGDSLRALELVAAAQPFGVTLSAATLLADPSFTELLASARASTQDLRSTATLRVSVADAIARQDLAPAASDHEREHAQAHTLRPDATLVVTGATGFLGRYVVALASERLARTGGRMICLVRGRDRGHAQARLEAALARVGSPASSRAVVEAVVGDLGRPDWGLAPEVWARLADETDAILHSGAQVHLGLGFDALRSVNVDATATALRLALIGRRKQLHHISSLSVFVAAEPVLAHPTEDDDLGAAEAIHGGYAQSKWAAEQLVRELAPGQVCAAIHRLGLITGDVVSGRGPDHDQLGLVIRGVVELGAIPAGHEQLRVDVTPVDHAARSLVELVLAGPALTREAPTTYHLASTDGATAADLLAAVRRSGAKVELVDALAWRRLGQTLARRSPAAAIAYLALGRCLGDRSFARVRAYDLFQSTGFVFGQARAQAVLGPAGLSCPAADAGLLDRYVEAARRGRVGEGARA